MTATARLVRLRSVNSLSFHHLRLQAGAKRPGTAHALLSM
jgi:hypothetical protein